MKEFEHSLETHPEGHYIIDHILSALEELDIKDPLINLAILLHDIGKIETYTYDEEKKRHRYFGHTEKGLEIVEKIARRLRLSNEEKEAIQFSVLNHMKMHDIFKMRKSKLMGLISSKYFNILLKVIEAGLRARKHLFYKEEWERLLRKVDEIKSDLEKSEKIKEIINGDLLQQWTQSTEFQLSQGKQLGYILKNTIEWMQDNNIYDQEMTKKYALDLLRRIKEKKLADNLSMIIY